MRLSYTHVYGTQLRQVRRRHHHSAGKVYSCAAKMVQPPSFHAVPLLRQGEAPYR